MFYRSIKALVFMLDPETAHRMVLWLLRIVGGIPGAPALLSLWFAYRRPLLRSTLCGLPLDNPVGLAAGFDKDGLMLPALYGLGFGFVEVGTVTPRSQEGNPRPRLFRLPEDEALINRLGFNNEGAWALAGRMAKRNRAGHVLGINLGKQRETPLDEAVVDYLTCLHALHDHADYLVINVSSPNTPGLRDLQLQATLAELLRVIVAARNQLTDPTANRVPLLLKIAPDLADEDVAAMAREAQRQGVDGMIAGNTTLQRVGLRSVLAGEQGGLSGVPLQAAALRCVAQIYRATGGKLPVIGVGGVNTPESAYALIRAGAVAVQLYTGLIYHGPGLLRRINRGLVRLLEADGFASVGEAVGADHRPPGGNP